MSYDVLNGHRRYAVGNLTLFEDERALGTMQKKKKST